MNPEHFNSEFNKRFEWFGNLSVPTNLKVELDLYKKLWNFFLVGDSYYFIINHHTLDFDFVSKEIEHIMGYTPSEVNVEFMNGNLHPEDSPFF